MNDQLPPHSADAEESVIGALLIAKFHWILYVFGIFLLITGVKMMMFAESEEIGRAHV